MKIVKFVRSDENGGLREEAKLYAIGESDDCCWFKPSEVRDMIDDGFLREVPEVDHKDVSFLVEENFVRFFTSTTVADRETPIMERFRGKVIRARGALTAFGKYKRSQSVWRDMCDRFYPQEERVRPEKMIQHLNELGTNEVVELLWFAVVYCDRWCEGKYEEYTNSGLIGKLLTRLQELPHMVCLDDVVSSSPKS